MIVFVDQGDSYAQVHAGVLPLSSNEGAPMSFSFRMAVTPESADNKGVEPQGDMREQLVTALATSLAVLIVGAIAVLMGMA
jgi:hypothetical protein